MVYRVGTCQCVVTKSAQSCLTNDPELWPVFSMFDSVYNILLMSLFWPVFLSSTLMPKFTLTSATAADKIARLVERNPNLANVMTESDGVQVLSGFYNPELWCYMQLVIGAIAAVFAACAILGLWRKANVKYFGIGKAEKVSFRDYANVLAHNPISSFP